MVCKSHLLFTLCVLHLALQGMNLENFLITHEKKISSNSTYYLYTNSTDKIIAHVIKSNFKDVNLQLVPALGQREEVSSIAKRANAIIAINGSNYRRGGRYNGNRLNLMILKGKIISDLQWTRGTLCWNHNEKKALIDLINIEWSLQIGNNSCKIDRVNQPRAQNEAVLFTSTGKSALTRYNPGINIVIENDQIKEITIEYRKIPKNGFIYQLDSDKFNNEIKVGMPIQISYEIKSKDISLPNDYDFLLGGAGLLAKNGKLLVNELTNEFTQGNPVTLSHDEIAANFHIQHDWLINQKHPRTAICMNDNYLYFVVVEGRNAQSDGMTLPELGKFMLNLGCQDILNIGGGGCTTLYLEDQIINRLIEERPVSEAICVI